MRRATNCPAKADIDGGHGFGDAAVALAGPLPTLELCQRNPQRAQGLAEYALILALIAIVAIVALQVLGTSVSTLLSAVGNSV
jgi:pilus assembly protein Flp/PilA